MTAIIVPDAHARANIAAIRSLGRAGYEVHAISHSGKALGLKSAFASHTAVHPAFDNPDFIPWLRQYVTRHHIRMIVPGSGILHALRPAFAEFKRLLPVTADEATLYRCFSKIAVVEAFQSADPGLGLMNHHPASTVVALNQSLTPSVLPASSSGYFIKADAGEGEGGPGSFAFATTAEEALAALAKMTLHFQTALVQEACDGVQVCVSVFMDDGKPLVFSSVCDRHPIPHSRGTMSYRESCWLPEIIEDTVKRLAYLKWQGCAMGEYRYDPVSGAFNLIEINFRYWQYLHLDLYAGVDYPRFQAEWFLNGQKKFTYERKLGVRCRDPWPGEVAHLVNELRRQDIGIGGKAISVLLFFARFFDPRIHQDFWFPGDRMLLWHNFSQFVTNEIRTLLKK